MRKHRPRHPNERRTSPCRRDDDDDVVVAPEFYRTARALFSVYREALMLEDSCAAHTGTQLFDVILFHITSLSFP